MTFLHDVAWLFTIVFGLCVLILCYWQWERRQPWAKRLEAEAEAERAANERALKAIRLRNYQNPHHSAVRQAYERAASPPYLQVRVKVQA